MKQGVAIVKGSDFLLEGGRSSLRLAFSAVTVDQIDEGVRRLAAAIDEVARLTRSSADPDATFAAWLAGRAAARDGSLRPAATGRGRRHANAAAGPPRGTDLRRSVALSPIASGAEMP